MADAKLGDFNIVAVAKLDRFMRNLRVFNNTIQKLDDLGVAFASIQESVDTSDKSGTGRLFMNILAAFAEFESARIGERIADGKRQRVSQGKWASGRVQYGYLWDPHKQEWIVVEEEAKIVRYIYHLYVNENMGSMKIPTHLNVDKKFRTRDGKPWWFSSINRILTHPAYKGEHYLGIKMPAIVDTDTWEQAQQKRNEGKRMRGNSPKWLLQGLGVCGLCGRVISCIQKVPTARRQYVCHGRYKSAHLDGSRTCTLQRLDATWLEKAIWGKFTEAFANPNLLKESISKALQAIKQRRSQLEAGSKPVAEELDKVKKRKERLGRVFADGAISEESYSMKIEGLKKQESSLQHRLTNLNPEARAELHEIERWIPSIENMLNQRFLSTAITPWGIYAIGKFKNGDTKIIPLGFNLREKLLPEEGKPPIRTKVGMDAITAMVPPAEFWEEGQAQEVLTQNKREMLRAFGIKFFVYPDRIEIKGYIPNQVIKRVNTQSNGGRDTQSGYLSG